MSRPRFPPSPSKLPRNLLGHWHCIQEGLHRSFSEAPASLMWPRLIIFDNPGIQIGLQFVDCTIH